MKNVMGITLLATVLLAPSALALTQKLDIDTRGMHLKGHETLKLKRMLRGQLSPQMRDGYKLQSVKMMAKSKKGHGDVTLSVGDRETYPQVIQGSPQEFRSDHQGFHAVRLLAPRARGPQEGQRWQLHVHGNVKVKSISTVIKKRLKYDIRDVRGLQFRSKAMEPVNKIVGSVVAVPVRGQLSAIKLKAHKAPVKIEKVVVVFQDGQKVILDEMQTRVKPGSTISMRLRRGLKKPVKRIRVVAVSPKLKGTRGKLEVKVAR
jgi:hypothetical protein